LKTVFLLVYHKRERKSIKKERESIEKMRKEKRKALRVSVNKKGKSIFLEEKNISTLKSFYVNPFSPLPSYHFQNPFQKYLRKFHNSFWTIL
jgi:5-methylcytosine-specific restriction endonuclease McrBC GTP-binding regulatory subunit McrB